MTAGQAGKAHGQKIGSEIPRRPNRSTWLVTLMKGAGQVGISYGQRLVQKYPQTRQEYLAGNALDDCWSGRQSAWSKDWFRNTPQTRQEYLACNALEGCWSGRQIMVKRLVQKYPKTRQEYLAGKMQFICGKFLGDQIYKALSYVTCYLANSKCNFLT
jgi:hypothetical protein